MNIYKMHKRKTSSDDNTGQDNKNEDEDDENGVITCSIPLPIQTFFWRQTSPFIRPNISKLQDAVAMEQREACKLFEKVLVQNIQYGLSPSLTKAISSISRWRLIVSALPHVMHCCSALLYVRKKGSFDKLSASETKLLYTLHWILLDAAEECADAENEQGLHRSPEHYLLPVTTIQTFIYLFAPLIPHLKESDFLSSFRLENGYKIWIPLFHYAHPEIPSFIAHAKQNTFTLSRADKKIAIPKFGDVFIGSSVDKSTGSDNATGFRQNDSLERNDSSDIYLGGDSSEQTKNDPKKQYDLKKDFIEPSMATNLDVAVLRCLLTSQWIEDGIDWALNFVYYRLECMEKNNKNVPNYRLRSNSLPAPKRKFINEPQYQQSEQSKRNNISDDLKNLDSLDHGSKLKAFRDVRRSSFSGLPGLSGFQAFISSTSSASFGRHGSEKVKHKKGKKQLQSNQLNAEQGDAGKLSSPSSSAHLHHYKASNHPSSTIKSTPQQNQIASKTLTKSSSIKRSSHKIKDYYVSDLWLKAIQKRPSSANSFKNRKISLSTEIGGLIDRDDTKGKSMPTLHLLDSDDDKFGPHIYLQPEMICTPSRASLSDIQCSSLNANNNAQHSNAPPFPIITITEHSPVSSMNFFNNANNNNDNQNETIGTKSTDLSTNNPLKYKFYIEDDDSEHQQQQYEQTSAFLSRPLLIRCKSDSQINYSIENNGESLASINYVNKNGQISLVVVLKAIHSITLKDSVCTMRVCKMLHKILNKLIHFKLFFKRIGDIFIAKTYKTFKPNCENSELSVHHLFMDTLFRIIKQLGCSRGCGEGRRGIEAMRLKESILKTLKSLHEMSELHFLQYCEMLVTSHPIQEIMDIFHAFFGFCAEIPAAPLHQSSSHLTTVPLKKSPIALGMAYKNGYYNNFGAGFPTTVATSTKFKYEVVDAIIVKCTFKPFISRLVFVQKELKVQENMSLYCEIRQFISYVRDHHGGIFRNTALSGLIESTKFMLNNNVVDDKNSLKMGKEFNCDQDHKSQSLASEFGEKWMKGKKLNQPALSQAQSFSGANKLMALDTNDRGPNSTNDLQQHEWSNEIFSQPMSNKSQPYSLTTITPVQDLGSKNIEQKKTIQSITPQPSQRVNEMMSDSMIIIGNDFGMTMINLNNQQQDNINTGLQNLLTISSYDQQPSLSCSDKLNRNSFSRQTLKSYPSQPTFVIGINQKSTFFKARKQFKHVFGKNKIKQNSFDETPDLSRKNSLEYDRLDGTSMLPMELPLKKSKTILFEILKDGMLKFQFLLDSCTPGTIPDAQLIAAMLDLKAPVIARAAFLLECCHFVHRCNRGQWPGWMRMNFSFFRPSGPRSGSQTVIKSRASTTLQKYAGRCFYQWAELISSRLEDLLQTDINNYQVQDDNLLLNVAADENDFFSISGNNSKESNCPFALKVIACQLLYEITTYLRETHQYLLSKTSNSRRTSVVHKEKQHIEPPKPHNTNRRWSMALSSGFKDTSAHNLMLLANISGPSTQMHVLDHCNLPSERRISFVLHEAEIENDSNSLEDSNEDILYHDKKRLSQVGQTNLSYWNRGSGSGHESFRRRSIKLKKNDSNKKHSSKLRSATLVEDDYKTMFKRSNSLRSKRKISGASEKSDTSERYSGEDSQGMFSDDAHIYESMIDNTMDGSDSDMIENIPWLKITTLFATVLNFDCNHQNCTINCHKRVIQSTAILTKEVRKIYEKDVQPLFDFDMVLQKLLDDKEDVLKKEKKLKKILMGHSSPLKRKTSALNMERSTDSHSHGGVHNSTTGLTHGAIDVEYGIYESEDPRLIFHDVLNYRMESKQEENMTMLYILNQVKNPFHSTISMMLKSALILQRNQFEYLVKLSWNLILEDDEQISSSASVAIIVCSLKCPDIIINLLNNDLNHQNVDTRVDAINKFLKIWCNRHQCWQRLEDGAHMVLKLPPAAIEFTLPSPRIALECKPVVDPPYMPIAKTKVDEVAINQEPTIQKSFVAATKTRRKQQIELISKALQDQEDKLREERESYRFNSVPVTLQAAHEPVLYHTIDDHEDTDDDIERIPLHHLQVAQCFFPSSLTTASFLIVNLLEDTQINSDGYAVYDVAYKTIWHCLSEDSALFLRNLLEKLTREKKSVVIQTIRRLIRFVPRLPAQAAFTLYNYLIGFIMYHIRTPTEDSQEIIASVMSILWLIVPNAFGLFLKDLKQILRKEQCDSTILITANVPSAKKIIVHGPDASSIPTQFPVHEDTQFSQILTDSLDFFGIDESKHNEYFLVDTKTNQIHNLNAFVRDFYFFKRSQYPQISLIHMNPTEAYDKFQQQAFTLQFTELGKCLMTLSLIKTSFLGIQRVLFLHEELMKLPSFPRKALETNLTLYTGPMGREVLGIDTLHKIAWVKLVARMFEATSGFFADSSDIHLFLNVINGTLLLHCEDASILRLCMATYINAAHQFKNVFATNGYLLIVQTIVQIYGTHQTNSLLCRTIEFVFKQFYILHSKPFILQMFGAVAPLLDTDLSQKYETSCKIHPKAFFQLLQSLGQYTADPLDILELVEAEKPLKALDFCYQMDSETLTVLDSISLCVTVISYAPDSERGHQMLTVLDSILPYHLMHMQNLTTKKETPGGPRAELTMIHNISVCIKTLIYNCEALTRNFTGPQRSLDIKETSIKNTSPFIEIDEDSHSKYNPDSYYPQRHNRIEMDDGEITRLEFRKPRDLLLKIVSEFLTKSTTRFSELSKKISEIHQKNSSYELLDVKCHIRLAEIAHSLLKLAPYDPQTMACKGLVRYMNEILPNSEWRQESMRPALIMVLRRLDKTFAKISKKSAIKRTTDWEAARRLLKGVYLTFTKHPYIVHLPHLKSLINVCQNIIVGELGSSYLESSSSAISSWATALSQAPPPGFTSVAVRLISLQMIQLGDSQSLETICSGAFSSPEKSEIYLMNMIYPMCIRTMSGMKDTPKFRQCDINFVLNIILNILKPVNSKHAKSSDSSTISAQLKQFSLQQIGFLGLKILITCFEKQLNTEWYHIAKCIRNMADKPHVNSSTFWNFIDFISTYRSPLFVLMLPYIKCKYLLKCCENEYEQMSQVKIQDKLCGNNLPYNRSKGSLYVTLVNEMKSLREDIIRRKNNPTLDERSRSIVHEQNSSDKADNSGHRLSFAFSQLAASASKLSNMSSTNQNTATNIVQQQQSSSQQQQSHVHISGDQSTSSPTTSIKPKVLRGLSFRLSSDSRRLAQRGLSVKLATNQSDKRMFNRRTSYPDHPDVDDKSDPLKYQAGSEPKLFRRLTVSAKNYKPKGSISFSGEALSGKAENMRKETSLTITPANEQEQIQQLKQQRHQQKNQTRKSCRFKKCSVSSEERSSSSKSISLENSDTEIAKREHYPMTIIKSLSGKSQTSWDNDNSMLNTPTGNIFPSTCSPNDLNKSNVDQQTIIKNNLNSCTTTINCDNVNKNIYEKNPQFQLKSQPFELNNNDTITSTTANTNPDQRTDTINVSQLESLITNSTLPFADEE